MLLPDDLFLDSKAVLLIVEEAALVDISCLLMRQHSLARHLIIGELTHIDVLATILFVLIVVLLISEVQKILR